MSLPISYPWRGRCSIKESISSSALPFFNSPLTCLPPICVAIEDKDTESAVPPPARHLEQLTKLAFGACSDSFCFSSEARALLRLKRDSVGWEVRSLPSTGIPIQ